MKSIVLFIQAIAISTIAFAQIPTSGLVAYWPLNGDFTDAGPNVINGTNFASTATANKNGVANSAIDFANPLATVAQYATHPINSNVNFTGTQNFTITFLMYINSPYVHTCGLYDNNLNYRGYGAWFWTQNGFPQIVFMYKSKQLFSTNGALTIGAWRFITLLRDAGTMKIYINGVLNNSTAEVVNTPAYSFPARFGSMFFNTSSPPQYNGLHGKLDEFRIYNRVLTDAEITAMSATVLPIKLNSFTATNKNEIVNLQWQTTEEINSSHFEIERSTDGVTFTKTGMLNARGNSSISQNYAYNDKLFPAISSEQIIYYRLKSVDIDGSFTYSKIVPIILKNKNEQLLLYPTPTSKILNVQTTNTLNNKATILITDVSGRLLLKREIALYFGNNNIPIDVSSLQNGLYHFQLKTNTNSYTKQFMKVE